MFYRQTRGSGAGPCRPWRQDPSAGGHRQPVDGDARRLRRRHLQQAARDQRGLAAAAGQGQRQEGETARLVRPAEVCILSMYIYL